MIAKLRPKFSMLLGILFLVCCSFAAPLDWLPFAAGALTLSAIIVAVLYMLGIGLNLNDLKFLASEELYQLIATAIIIGVLFTADTTINSVFASFGITPTLQNASIATVNGYISNQASSFNTLKTFAHTLGLESSKNMYCSFSAMGFSVAPCGGFASITPAVTFGIQMIAISVTESNSLLTLLKFGSTYGLSLILPLGILMRTFKFTRGAGGLIIGFGVGIYLFLPLAVIFMDGITSPLAPTTAVSLPEFSCDIHSFSDGVYTIADINDHSLFGTEAFSGSVSLSSFSGSNSFDFGYKNAAIAGGLLMALKGVLPSLIYFFLIQSTLTLIIALSAFFMSMRSISRLAGAEVEISSLMRIS
ncbi:hypothetical protein HY990_00845 [Candidatus Micrarchaeota archaeon]|nr:hypothetical protein [Candidatus Micrarchaeota archaeon]